MASPQRVVVSGASGLVGRALSVLLAEQGHRVTALVRRRPAAGDDEVCWNPEKGEIDAAKLEGLDAAVHLSGDSLASGRWTAEKKQSIRDSRVVSTALLARTMAAMKRPPRVLISASASGVYGDRGEEWVDEASSPGDSFLARVAVDWEMAAQPAADAGIRVVNARLGVVLSPSGGVLAKMLPVFRRGLGGVIGNGRQHLSWIGLDDVVRAIDFLLRRDDLAGPINLVAPAPASNREFTKTLGRVLNRPTIFAVPAFVVRAVFGEMGQATILSSTRVRPRRLLEAGFEFGSPRLEEALRSNLSGAAAPRERA